MRPELDFHEDLRREEDAVGASDRSFGILVATVLAAMGGLKLWHGSSAAGWWLGIAAILAVAAIVHPRALAPANRLWLRLGLVMYKVVNPVVMAMIFYGAVLPTALVVRASGKDLLRLKRDPAAASYWIRRAPGGSPAETMKHQF